MSYYQKILGSPTGEYAHIRRKVVYVVGGSFLALLGTIAALVAVLVTNQSGNAGVNVHCGETRPALAAAERAFGCIQSNDYSCLSDVFDANVECLTIGYVPSSPEQCRKARGKQAILDRIKQWTRTWDNDLTNFGPVEFVVESQDTAAFVTSFNWFDKATMQPQFADNVQFMVTVGPDGKITRWFEFASVANQANMTSMLALAEASSNAIASADLPNAVGWLGNAYVATVYVDGAGAPDVLPKSSVQAQLAAEFVGQSRAAQSVKHRWANCGYIYEHTVTMINSADRAQRRIFEELVFSEMDSTMQLTQSTIFRKDVTPTTQTTPAPASQVVLDGSQVIDLADKTVYCIQIKDYDCLSKLFADDLTYAVVGYTAPGGAAHPCRHGDKQGFIDHIKGWQTTWANDYTYFGPRKFTVKSYDSASFTKSVNWFANYAGNAPVYASDVHFVIRVTPDGTQIKEWLEFANVYQQSNMTMMTGNNSAYSQAISDKNLAAAMGHFAEDYKQTIYVDGATSAPTVIGKSGLSSALSGQFATQTHATRDLQFNYAGCGYVYDRSVVMVNTDSSASGQRQIYEELRLSTMDENYQFTSSQAFRRWNAPQVPGTGPTAPYRV